MFGKDPAFKLFGHQIPLPECQFPVTSSQIPSDSTAKDDCSGLKKSEVERPWAENPEQLENSFDMGDSKEDSQHNAQKNEPKLNPTSVEDKTKTSSSTDEDKTLKKPDKIQQCPRCNSMDTKFCYFNNYNVNQPRHFCKNCQRYWTAGGTMRNVPVGAGRRRNKQLSSQYHRHIIVSSEGIPIPTTKLETSGSSSCPQLFSTLESSIPFRSSPPPDNSTVLKFGPDAPISESGGSILSLSNGEEPSLCGSSVTNGSSAQGNEVSELAMQRDRGGSSELNTSNGVQYYPVAPWVWYPNGICPPSIPLQFVAAPCWGGALWAGGGRGSVSIGSINGCLSSSSSPPLTPAQAMQSTDKRKWLH